LFIPWNPEKTTDTRGDIPDFGLGRYSEIPPHVCLQGGAEVKRATPQMIQLPPTKFISRDRDVQNALHTSQFQARDQAKAAVKGGHLPNKQLLWLIFIGPYFAILKLGPFTDNQLITRSHKPNASGDFSESLAIKIEKHAAPLEHDVYLLGTPELQRNSNFSLTAQVNFLLRLQLD
jgi:hypothetical protein